MPITFTGPEQIAPIATLSGGGSIFYVRPNVVLEGTSRWAFAIDAAGATRRIHAFLRNNATGTWTEQAIGTGPVVARGNIGLETATACPTYLQDPTNPTIVWTAYNRASDSMLCLVPFDTVAMTFGAVITGGPIVHGSDVVFQGHVSDDDCQSKTCLSYRAIDNKFLILYQGPFEVVGGDNCIRPYFVTYDRTGAVWSVAVPVAVAGEDNPYQPQALVTLANNKSYAVIVRPTNGLGFTLGSQYQLYSVEIDSANVISAKTLICTDVLRQREVSAGYLVARGTELLISYIQNNTVQAQRKAIIARATAGPAPVWALEQINAVDAQGPINDDFVVPSLAIGDDGNPYLFWVGAPTADFNYTLWYSQGTNAGLGWTVPTALLVTSGVNGDFMVFPTVSALLGVNNVGTFAIVIMDMATTTFAEGNAYFELGISGGVPAVGPGTIRLVSPLPVHLPDPRIHCAGSFQKRCVTAGGRNILLTKGTTGFYS